MLSLSTLASSICLVRQYALYFLSSRTLTSHKAQAGITDLENAIQTPRHPRRPYKSHNLLLH